MKIFSIYVLLLNVSSAGCTTLTPVADVKTISNTQTLIIYRNDGLMVEMSQWKANDDGSISGAMLTESNSRINLTVQAHAIRSVVVQNSSWWDLPVIIAGLALFVIIIFGLVYVGQHLPFFGGGL